MADVLSALVVLACPVGMGVMMLMMRGSSRRQPQQEPADRTRQER